MKTIFIIVWANIKSKKLQSIALSLVFVSVSILFFLSLRLFGTTGAYEELYKESKTSQSLIYVDGEDSKDIIADYLDGNPEILNVNILANFDDVIETNVKQGTDLTPIPDAFFTEYATGEYDQIKIIEGKSPTELLENEVIFSYGKSKLNNISLGDHIIVNTEQGSTEMTIAGIGVDLTYNFDTITLNRFWTTKATIDQLETGEKNYSIGISYKDYSKDVEQKILDEIGLALGENSSDTLIISYQVILQANSFFQIIMGAIFTLIGVILIVVGLFIIRSIVYNNIVTESKKIATLKSTGFSSNNIISTYLFEYGMIALVSIIIGIFGSLALSNVVLGDLNELSNMFGLTNDINVIQMIVVLFVILGVIEFTVYLVARGVSKIKPAVALNRGEQVSEAKASVSLISHKKMPISLALALKDMLNNKKTIITLILFIIATAFTVVTLSSVSSSLNTQKSNMPLWLGYDVDAKIVSSNPLDYDGHLDMISTLESSEYVTGTVTVFNDLNSQIYDENQEKYITSISQIFVTNNKEPLDFSVVSGRIPENENEIMIANNLLAALHKEIGDYVTVRSLGEEQELLIVGECQSLTNQGMTFRLFLDDIKEEFLNNSLIQVNFVDEFEDQVVISEIERLFGTDTTLVFETTNASMVSMLSILSAVTTGVISIFAVICLVVLLNLNLTNVNKERFNYGIYKSIGMNDQTIINIYVFKNSIINMIGVIVGAILSVLVVPSIMNTMTNSLGISEFPTSINYPSIFIAIAIVFAVTFLNAFIIKRTISLITPKELLIE
ncbi:MAG: ABC transporter permease [Tenericutes bacterium]|jgi:putative ABC transport system permease protein|nr:ABC transporter permease [Mycoplasmatota bacterium]